MTGRRFLEIGGIVAGAILIAFGAGALVLSINARNTVSDELTQQKIVGSPDMNPTDIQAAMTEAKITGVVPVPTCNVANKAIETGSDARCFAQYMRIHALEATGGLTYAEMGRYQSASEPTDAKGTNDPNAAAKDENGQPISNGQRNTWVTETALSTALNVSYMAEQTALFGIVVGIALLLTGIGLIVLAFAVFRGGPEPSAAAT